MNKKYGNKLKKTVLPDPVERKNTEDALRLSEKKIRAVFDQTFQFIGMMTPDGKLVEANRTAMQFAGIVEADCIGKFFWDTPWWAHSEEMRNKLRNGIKKASRGETVFFEATHPAADGSIHYIDFSLKPVMGEDGKVIFIIPEGRDITDRKRSEEELAKYHAHLEDVVRERTAELKESEERFRAFFNEAADGMILADAASKKFFMCNKAICRMLGYTVKEMCKLSVLDIHPREELPHAIEVFEGQARGDFKLASDMMVRRKNGTIFYADISTSVIFLKGKKYLMGSFRDISERKAAEAALMISEANYRSIFELASDAIMIRDIDNFRTLDANKAACEMFCCSKEEIIGRYIKTFMLDKEPYTWDKASHFYEKAIAGEQQLFEWPAIDRMGRSFWVEATIKRAVIGNKYCLISILRDITERKRLAGMKDDFMNSVSHELRTPLAAIKEGVSLVFEEINGSVGKENRNILSIVKKNVDRLNRLISNVLDFQRMKSDEVTLNFKSYDINNVIIECCNTMSGVAKEKKLELLTDLEAKIPKLLFDKDKMLQVLMNLVNNAVKFTERGTITISTKIEGNTVKVSVTDTGIGIKPEDIPKVFHRFWRGEDRAMTKTIGTGLGLAISKEIIEKHKGKIWIESEWGKGSVLSFILPLKERRG
ncbi:MAG: PAS domain S-box protein [Candidatus Omnitrophica bacterium]|nr:PAS domain S-box protein [Candidatus Omnitrophota bacterium]